MYLSFNNEMKKYKFPVYNIMNINLEINNLTLFTKIFMSWKLSFVRP